MIRLSKLLQSGEQTPKEQGRKPAEEQTAAVLSSLQPAPPMAEAQPITLRALLKQGSKPAPPSRPASADTGDRLEIVARLREAARKAAPETPAEPSPIVDWYGQAHQALLTISAAVRAQQTFPVTSLTDIARGFVTSLERDDRLVLQALSPQESGPSQLANMIRTAIFAVKLGKGMGYRPELLVQLALAGLLHDIGMFRLPDELVNEPGRWSPAQTALLHRHPTLGAEFLRDAVADSPWWLPDVVEQEHERIDGSGYPKALQGETIHEFAQIIGLADVLDAAFRSRLSRKALPPHTAMRVILARERSAFSARLLKCLLDQFSLFPVGTRTKLASGEIGIVIRVNPQFPLRPVLQITTDQNGQPLCEPLELDLSRNPLVHFGEVVETARAND